MDKEMIMLILNCLLALFVIVGFLFGLKGIKKAGLKLVFFLAAVIVAGIITPMVTKAVLQIQITDAGTQITIKDYLLNLLYNTVDISEIVAISPVFTEMVVNLPLLLGHLVVFLILCFVMSFISKIVYWVVAGIFLKEPKKKKGEKTEPVKKYRLLGGLVGAIQGLILLFVVLLPITGFVGMVNDIRVAKLSAETEISQTLNQTPSQKIINEYLPTEAVEVLDGYGESVLGKVFGIMNVDDACFNSVASVKVNGVKIKLRDEVMSFVNIYDNVAYLLEIELDGIDTLNKIDYTKLNKAIDFIFESKILTTALPDILSYGLDMLMELPDVKNNQQIFDLVTVIKKDLTQGNQVIENTKKEISNVVKIAQITAESGMVEEINAEAINIDNILNLLTKDNKHLYRNYIDTIFESKVLNRAIVAGLNVLVTEAEALLKTEFEDDQLNIGRINVLNDSMVVTKTEFLNFSSPLLDAVKELFDNDVQNISNDYRTIFNANLGEIIRNFGKSMDAFKNMAVFRNTGIYNNILDAAAASKYNIYVDFTFLKEQSAWVTETELLAKSVDNICESGIISYITKDADAYSVETEAINSIINALGSKITDAGVTKTRARTILEPLYQSKAFEKLIKVMFDEANNYLPEIAKLVGDDVDLGNLNTDELFNEQEKEKILSFIDNSLIYFKDIDLQDLKDDPFVTLIESDMALLGIAMDSIKSTALFGDKTVDGNVEKGVYNKLFLALADTEYAKYVDFNVFVEPNFSWNAELSKTSDMIESLVNKKIILDDGGEISLIRYIIEYGNFDVIFDQITTQDLENIFTPLLESKIFKPTAVLVLNKINEQIINVVGDLGVGIVEIEDIDPEEIQEIINILSDVADLVNDFTSEDFEISDLATGENQEKLAELLNNLQTNANNNGVFTEAYDALVNFIEQDPTIGTTVSEKLAEYEPGQVDWAAILALL